MPFHSVFGIAPRIPSSSAFRNGHAFFSCSGSFFGQLRRLAQADNQRHVLRPASAVVLLLKSV